MLQRLRHHSLVQRSICDPCDGRHNTGDVVSELMCRQRIQHARFLSSTTNRCDLCARCSIKHINTVRNNVFRLMAYRRRWNTADLIGNCQSFHERNEKIICILGRPNGIQVVAVRADHRAISVDETCFCCLPFPVDFENNPCCVRI